MTRKKSTTSSSNNEKNSLDRRRFLQGIAFSAGAAGMLASGLGMSGRVTAQGFPAPLPPLTNSQPPQLTELAGKTAYITAASDGIGLGIARACSNAGMKVVIGYRNPERLQRALPLFKPENVGVLPIRHDVTDRDGWKRLLDEINTKFGNLHLLVNNAGVKTLRKASEAAFAEWDNAVAVNLTGIYNGVVACLPHMLEHGEGSQIVTTTSMSGLLPGASAGVYTATKIAAVGLMEALRIELERTTVGTSAYCPGPVNTQNDPNAPRPPLPDGRPRPPSAGMDPLEAGERVLNGVRNNDLFILTHPEFKDGMQERFDAIIASVPDEEAPANRVAIGARVTHADIYPREIAHRRKDRKSYRG
ncbi:MAG: SDR family NAD(P)-dependent oxidoreductase [Gammaproteobacteria bacterium]|nr:SDR family NAD(P)-dependent oxidoreductase [Gammaproteobacteria bacterium]